MSNKDYGDDEMRPIEQDEEFFNNEFHDMLIYFPKEEIEKVTCYYKLKKILPSEKEYSTKCPVCDGFPIKDGCMRYTTEEHIKTFPEKFGLNKSNNV